MIAWLGRKLSLDLFRAESISTEGDEEVSLSKAGSLTGGGMASGRSCLSNIIGTFAFGL